MAEREIVELAGTPSFPFFLCSFPSRDGTQRSPPPSSSPFFFFRRVGQSSTKRVRQSSLSFLSISFFSPQWECPSGSFFSRLFFFFSGCRKYPAAKIGCPAPFFPFFSVPSLSTIYEGRARFSLFSFSPSSWCRRGPSAAASSSFFLPF